MTRRLFLWRRTARSTTGAIAAALVVTMLLAATVSARTHRRPSQSTAPAAQPNQTFTAACVMEPTTGTVIFEKDMHRSWPLASVTKMMLMLIVAEKLDDGSLKLSDQVTTSRKAAEMGGSQVYLKVGETFSLEDMMRAVVIHSANDASVAVAEYIAGSTDAFVEMMNREASRLGMKDTHYYSVHGLPPAPGEQADVSSAYDCAVLARALVGYPQILRWSSVDTGPFRNGTFVLRNTNHLIRTFPGCDGLKTGFYDQAGFNVVATAHRSGLRLIAVVLGSPRKEENFGEAAVLLSQGFAGYEMYPVAKKGSPISKPVAIANGSVSGLVPVWGDDLAVFCKRGEHDGVRITYELPSSVDAPLHPGQHIGKGEAFIGSNSTPAGSAPIVSPAEVKRDTSLWRRLRNLI